MSEVSDVLIGGESVLIELENGENYRFEKEGEHLVEFKENVPETVKTALDEEGFSMNKFPRTMKFYLHDDAEPYDYKKVSEEIGLPEDDSLVQRIAGVGYEVELTIKVEDEHTAYITHLMGEELVEPKKL